MICAGCAAEKEMKKTSRGEERLPRGWKRRGGSTVCAKCWKSEHVLRAVTVPVVGPVCTETPGATESEAMGWPDLRSRLRDSWIATTQAANYILRQLALSDPGLSPETDGKVKALPMPRVYCYPEIRKRWPHLATCSVNCLEQSVQCKYRKERWDLLHYQKSLPTMRYPVPIPVHKDTWRVWEDKNGRLLLTFRLSGSRLTVRLRGGQQYRRQLAMVRKIISGEALQGELSIYRVRSNPKDNRNGDTPNTRVMAKLVAWMPKDRAKEGSVASMMTAPDAFLVMYDANRHQIFRWNRDDVRRKLIASDDQMQRLREDLKAERRLGRNREGILARMELLGSHHRHYLHTVCHQTSREVVNMLKRRRCSHLIYTGSEKGYLPHFPWYKLNALIEEKCDKAGIVFTSESAMGADPK